MLYTTKVAVCFETRTKHSTETVYHVEFLNVKPGVRIETACYFVQLRSAGQSNISSAHRPPTFTVHNCNITISAFKVTHKDKRSSLKMAYNNNNIYLLQMGCHPVAVITLHVFPNIAIKFTYGGLQEKHVVSTWKIGYLGLRGRR
jgi:hypothetical protein